MDFDELSQNEKNLKHLVQHICIFYGRKYFCTYQLFKRCIIAQNTFTLRNRIGLEILVGSNYFM